MFDLVLIAVLSFMVGSFPTGFLVGKFRGVDIRKEGSGNIGATNAIRILGKGWGSLVLIVDILKGFIPCALLPGLFATDVNGQAFVSLRILSGLATVCGHNFTPWLRFRGGKGIATSAGVMLGLMPAALGLALAVWILVFLVGRYVSLASIFAAIALPCAVHVSYHTPVLTGFGVMMGGMAVWRHKSNIKRLLDGTENRVAFDFLKGNKA